MNNSGKPAHSLLKFGMRGSEEYRKLMTALDVAENRREKLEKDLDELGNIVRNSKINCGSFLTFIYLEKRLRANSRQCKQ